MSKPTLTLTKFTLYETKTRFYIIGTDSNNAYFRILKIDRTVPIPSVTTTQPPTPVSISSANRNANLTSPTKVQGQSNKSDSKPVSIEKKEESLIEGRTIAGVTRHEEPKVGKNGNLTAGVEESRPEDHKMGIEGELKGNNDGRDVSLGLGIQGLDESNRGQTRSLKEGPESTSGMRVDRNVSESPTNTNSSASFQSVTQVTNQHQSLQTPLPSRTSISHARNGSVPQSTSPEQQSVQTQPQTSPSSTQPTQSARKNRTSDKSEADSKEETEDEHHAEQEESGLNILDDGVIYTREEIEMVLRMIEDGNKTTGGVNRVCIAVGIGGFIRFTEGYYLLLITRKSNVAILGGHSIFHIDETKLISITNPAVVRVEKNIEEARYIQTFQAINLHKNFYFSYTYDLTHSLQYNMTWNLACPKCIYPVSIYNSSFRSVPCPSTPSNTDPNAPSADNNSTRNETTASNPRSMALDMFVWNYSLLRLGLRGMNIQDDIRESENGRGSDKGKGKSVNTEIGGLKRSVWMVNIIHGFVDQAKISVFGRPIYVTLIARRSRHFAGARFHKRGVNNQGFVANEVETEQIVHDASTTTPPLLRPLPTPDLPCPFCTDEGILPGGVLKCLTMSKSDLDGKIADKLKIITERYNRHYTSFVQHRGSIPLYWSQDTSNMAPKPPIELNIRDPFFSASALHFDSLFQRYGAPVIILNLIKNKEKTKRESILGDELAQAVEYLNQFLPQDMNIKYIAWDMSRASKTGQDVIGILENIAEQVVLSTGFFHSGPEPYVNTLKRGEGWPDRIIGRRQQGIVRTNCIDCLDRTNAAQFVIGKCAFAHQLYALGAIPHPFLPFDTDATNMLTEMYQDHGDTIALQYGGSHLVNTMDTYRKSNWASHGRDMVETIRRYYSNTVTDAEKQEAINLFLGNFGPKGRKSISLDLTMNHNRSYIDWWTKRYLLPPATTKASIEPWKKGFLENANEDYFKEYYRPRQFTSMSLLFAFNMMSTMKVIPSKEMSNYDYSPFKVRTHPPVMFNIDGLKRWLQLSYAPNPIQPLSTSSSSTSLQEQSLSLFPPLFVNEPQNQTIGSQDKKRDFKEKEKESASKKAMSNLVEKSLDPQVSSAETREYKRYINQFRPSAYLPLTPSAESGHYQQGFSITSHPDYTYYSTYLTPISAPQQTTLERIVSVHPYDQRLYEGYVHLGVKMQEGHYGVGINGGGGSDEGEVWKNRVEGYRNWVTTGRLKVGKTNKNETAGKLGR